MDEKKKALERVRLLLRKADGNSNEEEARTSSHIAVKLILKHGLVISLPKPDPFSMYEDLFDVEAIFRQAQERVVARQQAAAARAQTHAPASTPRKEEPPESKQPGVHYEVHYGVGFNDHEKCAYCGRPLNNGYIVYKAWSGGVHIHKECQPAYEASHG